MSHWFYITPEEYTQAAAIGVDSENLNRRVRLLGWNKEKAITTPLGKLTDRKVWVEIAKQNGIGYYTFMSRVNRYGWDEERAATTPLQDRKAMAAAATERIRIIPRELVQRAEQNGIAYDTLHARITRYGWNPEEAATRRTLTRQEIGRLGKQAVEARYGDWNRYAFTARAEGMFRANRRKGGNP